MITVVSNVFLSFRSQAPVATVFAGSPQLLGAVKLGSGSAVTSLPLYSDINLLRRTEDVSEMKDSFPKLKTRRHLFWQCFALIICWNINELNWANVFLCPCRLIRCMEWDPQRTSIRFWPLKRQTMWSSRSPFVTSFILIKAVGSKTCSTSPMDMWVWTLLLLVPAADSHVYVFSSVRIEDLYCLFEFGLKQKHFSYAESTERIDSTLMFEDVYIASSWLA